MLSLDEPKYWISIVVGLVVIALGGIPLLGGWGIISFSLPSVLLFGWDILLWIVAVVGAYLLIDAFISEDDALMWSTVVVAIIIMGMAIIQILFERGIIGFGIPFLGGQVLRILFLIEGIGILIAGLLGDK